MYCDVGLVASVRPHGRAESQSKPNSQWQSTISNWSVSGRFAFFVFHVHAPFPADDWFPGLELQQSETGYYVGGSFDKWDSACYALLSSDMTCDPCCEIYRTIHNQLSSFGYTLRGTKTTNTTRFMLR